jgi:hypothetical protein
MQTRPAHISRACRKALPSITAFRHQPSPCVRVVRGFVFAILMATFAVGGVYSGAFSPNGGSGSWTCAFGPLNSGSYSSLNGFYRSARFTRDELPPRLLNWLERFQYERLRTPSGLLLSVAFTIRQSMDCDALELTSAILLAHLEYDAIAPVSSEYRHVVAGVDVEGPAARLKFDGTEYLPAEMTEEVDLGQAPTCMPKTNGWIGMHAGSQYAGGAAIGPTD